LTGLLAGRSTLAWGIKISCSSCIKTGNSSLARGAEWLGSALSHALLVDIWAQRFQRLVPTAPERDIDGIPVLP
jgi:hypothetical protein